LRRDDEDAVIPANAGIQQWSLPCVVCVGPGLRRDDEDAVIPANAGIQQ